MRGSCDTAGHGYCLLQATFGRIVAVRCRAPDRATRPSCSTARSRRTTAARPATRRRRASARRSPGDAAGTARRRTSSSHRRRSSAPAVGTRCRRRRTRCRARCTARRRRPGSGSQFSISRGQEVAAFEQQDAVFPSAASVCASVPPPAPVPMMITSKRSGMVLPLACDANHVGHSASCQPTRSRTR